MIFLFLLYTLCLWFVVVSFTTRMHLIIVRTCSRGREPRVQGEPRESLTGRHYPSIHRGLSCGYNGVLATAPGKARTYQGPSSSMQPGQGWRLVCSQSLSPVRRKRDIDGTQPRHIYCSTGVGEQTKLKWGSSWRSQRNSQSFLGRDSMGWYLSQCPENIPQNDGLPLLFKMWFI